MTKLFVLVLDKKIIYKRMLKNCSIINFKVAIHV